MDPLLLHIGTYSIVVEFEHLWFLWTYKNNITFNPWDAKPAHGINLTFKLLNDMSNIILNLEFSIRSMLQVSVRSLEEKVR